MERTALAITLTAALGGAVLEAAPLPNMALTAETERMLVYSRVKSSVDVPRLERSLEAAEKALGQKYVGRLQYFHYDYPEEVAFATGRFANGVTLGSAGQVHSVPGVSDHEIVHAVAWQMGNPGSFFHEGLAVALADRGKWWGRDVNKAAKAVVRRLPVSAALASFNTAEPGDAYYTAGSFMSWLIKQYGLPRVASFFRACRSEAAAGTAFAETFGLSLNDASARWEASL